MDFPSSSNVIVGMGSPATEHWRDSISPLSMVLDEKVMNRVISGRAEVAVECLQKREKDTWYQLPKRKRERRKEEKGRRAACRGTTL